jgi:hypothetical protein
MSSSLTDFLTTFQALADAAFDNVSFGPPTTNEEKTGLYLLADENGAKALELDQQWHGQGSHRFAEQYTLPGLLFRRIGDSDQATADSLFLDLVADFDALTEMFRPDASLGVVGYTLRSHVTGGAFTLLPRPNGLLARAAFTITVNASI